MIKFSRKNDEIMLENAVFCTLNGEKNHKLADNIIKIMNAFAEIKESREPVKKESVEKFLPKGHLFKTNDEIINYLNKRGIYLSAVGLGRLLKADGYTSRKSGNKRGWMVYIENKKLSDIISTHMAPGVTAYDGLTIMGALYRKEGVQIDPKEFQSAMFELGFKQDGDGKYLIDKKS